MSNNNRKKTIDNKSGEKNVDLVKSTDEKPTSPQLDITKQIIEVLKNQRRILSELEALKRGQVTQDAIVAKLTKVKTASAKDCISVDELVT